MSECLQCVRARRPLLPPPHLHWHSHTLTHTYTHTCFVRSITRTLTHIHTRTRTRTHIRTHAHTHTHDCTRTHALLFHTHKHTLCCCLVRHGERKRKIDMFSTTSIPCGQRRALAGPCWVDRHTFSTCIASSPVADTNGFKCAGCSVIAAKPDATHVMRV